jgi:hypothetical protein
MKHPLLINSNGKVEGQKLKDIRAIKAYVEKHLYLILQGFIGK